MYTRAKGGSRPVLIRLRKGGCFGCVAVRGGAWRCVAVRAARRARHLARHGVAGRSVAFGVLLDPVSLPIFVEAYFTSESV